MNASLLAFLAVPLVTGAANAVWAPIARLTWTGMSALNALSYTLIFAAMLLWRREDPGLTEAARTLGWWPLAAYVALTCAITMAYFVANHATHVVWIAVGDMAWPACVLVFTLMLARWTSLPVEPPSFGPWHALGGALVVAGVGVLAWTEARP